MPGPANTHPVEDGANTPGLPTARAGGADQRAPGAIEGHRGEGSQVTGGQGRHPRPGRSPWSPASSWRGPRSWPPRHRLRCAGGPTTRPAPRSGHPGCGPVRPAGLRWTSSPPGLRSVPEGRTGGPGRARSRPTPRRGRPRRTSPPLLATPGGVASSHRDPVNASSCQNVLRGSSRWPMGRVAQTVFPAGVELARGMPGPRRRRPRPRSKVPSTRPPDRPPGPGRPAGPAAEGAPVGPRRGGSTGVGAAADRRLTSRRPAGLGRSTGPRTRTRPPSSRSRGRS